MKGIKINQGRVMRSLCFMLVALSISTTSLANANGTSSDGKFHRFWPDNLYAVEFVNDKLGFVAGYSGSLFKTEDAGETWSAIYMGVSELVRQMSFVDEKNGWAVGHRGSILHTADGGLSWDVQLTDEGVYLRDISFADVNNGWAVGHGATIWHTQNGGKNWEKQTMLGFEGRDLPRLHSIVAKDANTAILVGEFGVVAHTENSGKHWLVSYNKGKGTLLSITNRGSGAIAVGLDGGVYQLDVATDEQREEVKQIRAEKLAKIEAKARKKAKRKKREYIPKVVEVLPESDIDYAITKIDSGIKEHLYDITEAGNGDAIAVGVSTVIKISGASITDLTPPSSFPLPYVWIGGVDVTPSGTLWAAGIRGMILKGNVAEMKYDKQVNIAEPGKVKLISNRWGE